MNSIYVIINKLVVIILRNPIFSPLVGGKINPNILHTEIIKVGSTKLNEKNNVRLRKLSVTVTAL